ncbi:hypothetical protein EPUL_003556, partial [Erysiphe pulchra]
MLSRSYSRPEDIAPPTREKKRGVSQTLDPKSRVQKSVTNARRAQPLADALTRSASKANAVAEKFAAVQGVQFVAPQSDNSSTPAMNIDSVSESDSDSEPETDEFPPLLCTPSLKRTSESLGLKQRNMPNLIVYKDNSWAARAASGNISAKNNSKRRPLIKSTPPQGQSHEDRRVMVRLEHDHQARKTEPFLLRQQLQRILPDPSLVADAMQVPSDIAILAPTPAKEVKILQYRDVIAQRFGKVVVERQESWTTFIIGPLPKQVTNMDGKEDPLDGLLFQESGLAAIRDEVSIKRIAWTKRSRESSDLLGQVRIHILKAK